MTAELRDLLSVCGRGGGGQKGGGGPLPRPSGGACHSARPMPLLPPSPPPFGDGEGRGRWPVLCGGNTAPEAQTAPRGRAVHDGWTGACGHMHS